MLLRELIRLRSHKWKILEDIFSVCQLGFLKAWLLFKQQNLSLVGMKMKKNDEKNQLRESKNVYKELCTEAEDQDTVAETVSYEVVAMPFLNTSVCAASSLAP